MSVKEEYDVLRLIEHNQNCYISSECVRGESLPRWLKFHPHMKKEELFFFIAAIVRQLSQIHRCRGNPCYRYMNPYSIIVSEDKELYFIDTNAESNRGQLRLMQRRMVRQLFLPPDEPYYQKASIELDIYGLGKTIQYLLSQADAEPSLKRSEEIRFQKIISKCLNRQSRTSYRDVSEIQKSIPEYKKMTKVKTDKKQWYKVIVLVFFIAAGALAGICFFVGKQDKEEVILSEQNELVHEKETEVTSEDKDFVSGENEANIELGLLYFLELKNYGKSKEYFAKTRGTKLAEHMAVIAGCLAGEETESGELRKSLNSIEEGVKTEEKAKYYPCILRGYAFLGEPEDAEKILELGKFCLQDEKVEHTAEILGYMAAAYEETEKPEEAVQIYEEQMKNEEDPKVREGLYEKISELFFEIKQNEKAQETLRKGIKEFPQSEKLRMDYIKIQLKDTNMDEEICIENINRQLKEMPELKESEEFQKLMKEYGIERKGETVWREE